MATTTRASDLEAAILAKLSGLSPDRRQQVLDFIDALAADAELPPTMHREHEDDLISRYIDTVNVDYDHPSYTRLADFGTPVWAIVGSWKGAGDIEQVAREWEVPVEYVTAALAYYCRFPRYIDAVLLLNQSPPQHSDATDR